MTPLLRRAAVAVLGAVIVVPSIAGAILLGSIDPNAVKLRVIAEVQRAFGRQLAVGALRLRLFPDLTIDADDVALANPVGFSRAAMLTARHIRARVALVPLLSHHLILRELTVSGADLRLEQPAGLASNWRFAHHRPSAILPHAIPTATATGFKLRTPTILALTANGTLSWQLPDDHGAVAVQALRLREVNASSTIAMFLDATLGGARTVVSGRFGGQNHLWDAADRSAWPVQLKLTAPAGEIDLDGTIRAPRRIAGFDVTLVAHGPDLGALVATWPGLHLPRLRDVSLATRLIDQPDGLDIPRLTLTAGPSDLSRSVTGLTLRDLSIAAPNIDGTAGTQVNHIAADGRFAGQALTLQATLGPIGRLFGRGQVTARSPIALDATATAAGAALQVQGRVQPSGDWRGTDATLHAAIPDLAALDPLIGQHLPALHAMLLDGAVQSAHGVLTLQAAHLSLPQADLRVSGTAEMGARPRYAGQVQIARLNLDALLPVLRAAASTPPSSPAAGPGVIGQAELPFSALGRFDADVMLAADTLRWRGVDLSRIATRVHLTSGRLDIDPFSLSLGQAPVTATLSLDAARTPPAIALEGSAPGLDAASVAALLGLSGAATGRLDLDAALAGSGDTPHAIAATLSGYLGIALTAGTLSNQLLLRGLTLVAPVGKLDLPLPQSGNSDMACLATRFDVRGGIAVPRDFLLDTPRFRVAAAGAIDLGAETMALRLRPYIRLGAIGLVVPSRADGAWRDPSLTIEPAQGTSASALAAQMLAGSDTPTDMLGGLAAPSDAALALADSGDCSTAVAAARDTSGAAPTLPNMPAPPIAGRERAIALLKRLFR